MKIVCNHWLKKIPIALVALAVVAGVMLGSAPPAHAGDKYFLAPNGSFPLGCPDFMDTYYDAKEQAYRCAGPVVSLNSGVMGVDANGNLVDLKYAISAYDINNCAPGIQSWQVTTKVVTCIRTTIINAVVNYVNMLTVHLKYPVIALFTLAVMFYGLQIMMGEKEIPKLSFSFIIRFVLVAGFAFNMSQMVMLPFAMVEDVLAIVTGGWSPWVRIDNSLATMMGFGPDAGLYQGLLGLIGAAIYSSSQDTPFMFVFLFGVVMLILMLSLIFRAVYTFLASMVLIGFLMALSPMMVPLAVMGYSEKYFRKWIDLLIAAMLQPVLLFAFLWLFLNLIETCIAQIFNVLGGNDFMKFWRANSNTYTQNVLNDPTLFEKMGDIGKGTNVPPVMKTFMNPIMGNAIDMNMLNQNAVNFSNGGVITQAVIINFVAMGLTCYLVKTMLEAIPEISDRIAGASTGIGFEKMDFLENVKQAASKAVAKG